MVTLAGLFRRMIANAVDNERVATKQIFELLLEGSECIEDFSGALLHHQRTSHTS